jgi:hypothetical protein
VREELTDQVKGREPETKETQEPQSGLTLRAIIVSILFIILATYIWLDISYEGVWGLGFRVYWVYYDGYAPNNHALLPVFVIVLIIHPISRLLGSKLKFSNKELLTINNMTQFGVLVMASGFFQRFISSSMMGLSIHANTNPFLYGDIAERFANAFFVKPDEIARWFQEGPGAVPWSAWFTPFLTWSIFLVSMLWLFFCIGVLLRKRWTEVEHLRYPIGVLKLAYIRGAAEDEEEGSLWRNPLIWIGIIAAFLFSGLAYFHKIWPIFPDTDMNTIRRFRNTLLSSTPDLSTAFYLSTTIHPVVMSAMWFVMSLDLLFSIWFFYIFRSLLNLIFIKRSAMGLMPGSTGSVNTVMGHAVVGAMVALAVSYLWLGRRDLLAIAKKALNLSGSEDVDDSEEPISYKLAFWSVIGCSILFILFCMVVLQMKFLLSFILVLFLICVVVSLARMRCEASVAPQLGIGVNPVYGSFMRLVGASGIGIENVGVGALSSFFSRPIMSFTGGFLEAWKMGDEIGEDRKTVSKGIWLSIFLGILATALIFIPYMYKLGFNQTLSRNQGYASGWASTASALKNNTIQPDKSVLFWYIYSFVSVTLLGWLRTVFAWWPFHPVGFAVGGTYIGQWFVDMAFFVWLIKAIVMRYGGYQVYRKITPIFLGLGVGQILASIVGVFLSTLQMMRIL